MTFRAVPLLRQGRPLQLWRQEGYWGVSVFAAFGVDPVVADPAIKLDYLGEADSRVSEGVLCYRNIPHGFWRKFFARLAGLEEKRK